MDFLITCEVDDIIGSGVGPEVPMFDAPKDWSSLVATMLPLEDPRSQFMLL